MNKNYTITDNKTPKQKTEINSNKNELMYMRGLLETTSNLIPVIVNETISML